MNAQEIKNAVRQGKRVFWKSAAYEVVLCEYRRSGGEQWLIVCAFNDSAIGLTHRDGETLNGAPEDFYIGEENKS